MSQLETYEVEHIVNHRKKPNGDYELYIKWVGFPHSDNTWEPLNTLYVDIKNIVIEYFKSRGKLV